MYLAALELRLNPGQNMFFQLIGVICTSHPVHVLRKGCETAMTISLQLVIDFWYPYGMG